MPAFLVKYFHNRQSRTIYLAEHSCHKFPALQPIGRLEALVAVSGQ